MNELLSLTQVPQGGNILWNKEFGFYNVHIHFRFFFSAAICAVTHDFLCVFNQHLVMHSPSVIAI